MAQAIEQPLDPQRLAQSVKNEEEALELYFLSCAAIDIDHFMERSYLNALGDALKIPQDVREGIERDIREQNRRYRDSSRRCDPVSLASCVGFANLIGCKTKRMMTCHRKPDVYLMRSPRMAIRV